MKLILSRKGVDSSSGGFASPIFPDGSLLSIAIPDMRARVRYREVAAHCDVGRLVSQLSGARLSGRDRVHLDPDLDYSQQARPPGWVALFGQCGAAQSHLASLDVGRGDVFVFFGWFREVEKHQRKWRYVPGAPDQHVIFGWMQVQSVVPAASIETLEKWQWMRYHPHCDADFTSPNVVYRAYQKLQLPGVSKTTGAGVFGNYHELRCLTATGRSRSIWSLPAWMNPQGRRSALSYHTDVRRWQSVDSGVELRSVARGQEFVLDLEHYPEGISWLTELMGT